MEIVWVVNAKNSLEETLDYWDEHNGTTSYSNKIISYPKLKIIPTHRNMKKT